MCAITITRLEAVDPPPYSASVTDPPRRRPSLIVPVQVVLCHRIDVRNGDSNWILDMVDITEPAPYHLRHKHSLSAFEYRTLTHYNGALLAYKYLNSANHKVTNYYDIINPDENNSTHWHTDTLHSPTHSTHRCAQGRLRGSSQFAPVAPAGHMHTPRSYWQFPAPHPPRHALEPLGGSGAGSGV